MTMDFSQLHFIRPLFLLALPPLVLLCVYGKQLLKNNHWEHVISKEMLAALQVDHNKSSSRWRWILLMAWVIATFAIAGPTWEKTALPTIKNQKALVIALDLSPSMLAQDLSPDRLTRAKFKLIDILRTQSDGQVALIAYAGDAHTVSPLTDDPRTIESLLKALHPNIMPSAGSNTEQAIALAQKLLIDAQAPNGDILLITDGVTRIAQEQITKQLKPRIGTIGGSQNGLYILGVGGTEPAPIPQVSGGFVRGADGEIILSSVNNKELNDLARVHNGQFASLSNDDSDIQRLLKDGFETGDKAQEKESQNVFYDSWKDMGHWLVLLLLPLAAYCFRKGLIYILPLMFIVPMDSQAQSLKDFSWDDLWRTKDQQAQQLVEQKQYAAAAEKYQRQDLAGAANYKAGNYQQAIDNFANSKGIDNLYNKANAQAFNGDLKGAIETYEKVLEQQPDFEEAANNKKIVEELLEQQEQQQNQQGDQNQEQQESSENSDSDQSEQQEQSEPQNQSDSQDQSESEQQSQQQDDSEQPSDQEPESQEQEKPESETSESEEQSEEAEEAQNQEEQAQKDQEQEEQAQLQAAEQTDEPLEDASEQWLRTITDDPGRLLRNKFQYQSQQRNRERSGSNRTGNNNSNSEIRY